MQCGCPVISSNISSLPEVVNNAGILIDPKSESELIKAMESLYFDQDLCHELSKKGLDRSMQFSWSKCVDIMVKEMLKD
jgi:glycosyltransferase involved in cell wall biosynthesis